MYVRPHLDYGDVLYHIPDKESLKFDSIEDNVHPLMAQIESVQYEAALIVSGAWKGTSRTKIYADLGWESLYHRRGLRRLCLLFEVYINGSPNYLKETLDKCRLKPTSRFVTERKLLNIPFRTNKFGLSFFPSTIKHWNSLDSKIKDSPNLKIFKKELIKRIRPKRKEYFGIDDKVGTRYITLLRMGLSPLKRHKFDYNFQDTFDPVCISGDGIEDTEHFLLHCTMFDQERADLTHKLSGITDGVFYTFPNKKKVNILLYGNNSVNVQKNGDILKSCINYIRETKRFDA